MSYDNSDLQARITDVSDNIYISTKAGIIEYAKDTYGTDNWKSRIAEAISGTTDRKSRAYKSARRNFESRRENAMPKTAKDRAKWAGIGRKLPPIGRTPPKGGYKVKFVGWYDISGKTHNMKNAKEVKITGNDAFQFMQEATFEQVFSEYFKDVAGGQNLIEDYGINQFSVDGM